MTIKEIDEKVQADILNQQIMTEKQKTAERNAQNLNAEAEAAAVAGDLDKYRELKTKAVEQEEIAYVLGKQIERGETRIDPDDISDAWNRYRADYEKKLHAGLKSFRETKLTMLRKYAEMVSLQRDACATRERLARYIGSTVTPLAAGKDKGLEIRFLMDCIPCAENGTAGNLSIQGSDIRDPDAAYYLSSLGKEALALARDPEAQTVRNVVRYHRA